MKRLGILVAFALVGLVAAVAPPGRTTEAQETCFNETGFCISNPAFLSYFRERGGVRILGYPVSRSFTLEGFEVQFFQRVVLQLDGQTVNRLNILDQGIMPMTRANGSVFPGNDPSLAGAAPQVGTSDYAQRTVQFIQSVSPDMWTGQQVGFFNLFNTTVPPEFVPGGASNPDLITLLNLEIWGLPTSQPASDPNNPTFIYQRFQRGIMHHRSSVPITEGILVADYLKSVITTKNLPPDLAEDMRESRFFNQYDPSKPNWLSRPAQLPNTNMTSAFEPGSGTTPLPVTAPATAVPGATALPTTAASSAPVVSTFRIDDERIDPGETIEVTVIVRDPDGVDWIQFEGSLRENDNANDNQAADSAFARQELDCDGVTECAKVFQITPSASGDYTLRTRARDEQGNRSEWTETDLRVREGQAAATATSVATTAATATAQATATGTPVGAPKP